MKKIIYQLGLWSLILTLVFACEEDPVEMDPPTASFQFEVGETDFLTVTFENFSQNFESSEWDFGDGSEVSTEESPVHTYEAAGTYDVTLTVTATSGETAERTESVEVSDPNQKLTLLTGTESKTWKLVREGTCMLLASDPELTQVHWAGLVNDGQRPCQYDDSFTFTREGDYIYDDGGTFWGEFGVWGGDLLENCFEAVPANMVNANGEDVSAWLGGTHSYSYDAANDQITLSGEGAWMGIPKLATGGESLVPVDEVTFNAKVVDGAETGVDTLYINFSYEGAFWPITYVSYEDPALEPDIVSVKADFAASANGLTVNFTNSSAGASEYSWDFGDGGTSTEAEPTHTYAEEGEYSVTLTASDGSSSNSITKSVSVSSVSLTDPAPTPAEAEADVISIYSDAYTSIEGVNTNPDWGQATAVTEETVQEDNVLLLTGLNYQGIDFAGNMQNVSGKTMIHLDVWSAQSVTFNFSLISDGPQETPYSVTTEAGTWTSVDIPLSEFSDVVDLTKIIQFKFDDAGSGASPSFYVDNMYFY